ncbi:MAG: protein kinase [Polyangiales bacterium]
MTSLDTSMLQEELIGEKYRLGPIIGSGGIATVRRATHVWTEREVAIKLLDPTLPHFEELRAGFLREARATVQLDHPNVVDVLDMGEDGWDTVYLVMELLDGPTLREVLLERGKLSEEDALGIMLPLLDALEKAHELGIVHRDFKPENIMLPLDAYGVVTPKLLDFGIAKVIRNARSPNQAEPEGVIMGTPEYMSPEQARDDRELIGPHTDVWGVAVVWYECLTGRAPFEGDSPEEVLRAVCEAPIDFYALPEKYVSLLRPALHRLPGFRMASISDLKARIEHMGFARATVAPAAASLSSVPAPMPAPPEEQPRAKETIVGLGPKQLFAPSPMPVDSEVIPLPTKSNRGAWLAGVGLSAAVAFAAWWTVRDPGVVLNAPSESVIAQPAPAAEEDERPEHEPEVNSFDEAVKTRVDEPAASLAAREEPEAAQPAEPEQTVETPAPEGTTAALAPEPEVETPAPEQAGKTATPEPEPEPEVENPTPEPETTAPDETIAPVKEPRRAKGTRARTKRSIPKDSQYEPPPEMVTEW